MEQLVHMLAPSLLYVLAGQYSHSALLVAKENLPARYFKHVAAPLFKYRPARQVMHALAPSALYEPAEHVVHNVDAFVGAYLPA